MERILLYQGEGPWIGSPQLSAYFIRISQCGFLYRLDRRRVCPGTDYTRSVSIWQKKRAFCRSLLPGTYQRGEDHRGYPDRRKLFTGCFHLDDGLRNEHPRRRRRQAHRPPYRLTQIQQIQHRIDFILSVRNQNRIFL